MASPGDVSALLQNITDAAQVLIGFAEEVKTHAHTTHEESLTEESLSVDELSTSDIEKQQRQLDEDLEEKWEYRYKPENKYTEEEVRDLRAEANMAKQIGSKWQERGPQVLIRVALQHGARNRSDRFQGSGPSEGPQEGVLQAEVWTHRLGDFRMDSAQRTT